MTDKSYADKAQSKIIYAVDLGSSHLTLMAGEMVDKDRVRVLGVERELCRGLAVKGVIDNPSEVASRLVRLSKQLKNRLRLTDDPQHLFVCLGGKGLRMTETEVDRSLEPVNHVSEKELRDMEKECRDKFERAYPELSVAEVIWGSFLLDNKQEVSDPLNKRAKLIRGSYEVYYGQRNMRYKWDDAISRQNQLSIASYFVNTEAQRTALLNSDEEQEGCAIINFGADTTTYCAYHHGKLLDLLVVPFGSYNLTKDIAYKAISDTDAEKLKKAVTSLLPPEQKQSIRVDSAIEPGSDVFFTTEVLHNIAVVREEEILSPILAQIKENIDILEDKKLYITGGGAKQKGLIDFLQDRIQMQVLMGSTSNRISDDTDIKYASPEYSQLIGTILLADEYMSNNVITIPSKKKEPKPRKSLKDRLIGIFDDTADL